MKTALLVIDVQNIYTDHESDYFCQDSEKTVNRINRIISKAEASDVTILFVRHINKADGSQLGRMYDYLGEVPDDFDFKEGTPEVEYDSALKLPDEPIEFTKNRYSAFFGTSLLKELQKRKVDSLIITGFMTNFCCEATAREAHDRDFFVDFVIDATGSPGTEEFSESDVRTYVASVLEEGIARVVTTKQTLKEL